MGVVLYALFAYALTALIAFGVVALIVFVNYLMNRNRNRQLDLQKSSEEVL
ncbi:MAG: hypothetical protein ACOWWO_14640 [Peptococcaceae bacterium]